MLQSSSERCEMCLLCSIAMTKLDILDDQPVVKIGVAYLVNGQAINYYPGMSPVLLRCVIHDNPDTPATASCLYNSIKYAFVRTFSILGSYYAVISYDVCLLFLVIVFIIFI